MNKICFLIGTAALVFSVFMSCNGVTGKESEDDVTEISETPDSEVPDNGTPDYTKPDIETPDGQTIIINETGFESGIDESEYTMDSWISDGFHLSWVQGFNQSRAHFDSEQAHSGSASLRIDYPANTYCPGESGAQAPLTFSPQNEVYVSYWLKFSGNFDWGGTNEGGKLPGLAGGDLCSGGGTCDGTNGFTARLMWRPGGRAILYLYDMDKASTYPEDRDLITGSGVVYFEKDEWYQIIERVKINTGDNNDGEVQIWINGEEALFCSGLRFVNDGSMVDTFYFSTFHGGGDSSWAPSEDCYIWFDDIRIYCMTD